VDLVGTVNFPLFRREPMNVTCPVLVRVIKNEDSKKVGFIDYFDLGFMKGAESSHGNQMLGTHMNLLELHSPLFNICYGLLSFFS
jgi:hypothetical protein